jgi:hypothetical protein
MQVLIQSWQRIGRVIFAGRAAPRHDERQPEQVAGGETKTHGGAAPVEKSSISAAYLCRFCHPS